RGRRSPRPRSSCPSSRGSTSPRRAAPTLHWRRTVHTATWRPTCEAWPHCSPWPDPPREGPARFTRRRTSLRDHLFLERRRVHLLDVLLHHPPGREARRDAADRFLDDGEPAVRDVRAIAIVEGRHDLFLEQAVECGGVSGVDGVGIVRRRTAVD